MHACYTIFMIIVFQEIIYEAFIHDAVMLFATGLNNTIKEKMKSKGFKRDTLEGYGKEIRDKISELIIEGTKVRYAVRIICER